jgi:flagellar biosynthesis/type III secretory pathway protein FliH
MSRESRATKEEIQRNRDEAYQNGWSDGYAEGYGKATEDAIARLRAVLAEVEGGKKDE